ncbi:Hvo_1808 family surface protein [Halococcus agarilyticus]|uniref:Hvo_1808 family surface protein n=1 Tax=Halococcus agarilyticus TaxID=1232219 RepID=UPI000677AF54|nr:Hvo_1808 family surface protein [Halococcus agarilyticus]
MRTLAALLLAALVVLAGCSVPFTAGNGSADDATQGASPTPSGDATATPAAAGDTDAATGTTDGASTTSGDGSSTERTDTQGAMQNLADPPEDVLGWENGVWYNESIPVAAADGLNATERRAVVNRTMARIERVRELEFNRTVPVEVISREEFQQRPSAGTGGDAAPAFRTFDNAKFEGLFLIGEAENSLAVQQANRGQSVAGYYSPTEDSIVVVSESATPRLNRSTLAHELVHALQDQQFDLAASNPATREAYNARNGLIEGEANYVQRRYDDRCGGEWECLDLDAGSTANTSAGDGLHLGVYVLSFFPYADGPGFVDAIYQQRGWEGVNALHDDLPASTEQVIRPDLYGEDAPTNVSIDDTSSEGWSRVELERPGRPDYAVLGQSALAAMFAYTLYDDYNRSTAVSPREFLNTDGPGQVNQSDPFNYGLNYTDGWDGDKMFVYQQRNRTGYVWKLTWDSPAEAREFVAGYEQLLAHWGGSPVGEDGNVWQVREESPFADAFSIQRDGDTVTIVNAPTVDGLDAVHDGAADG